MPARARNARPAATVWRPSLPLLAAVRERFGGAEYSSIGPALPADSAAEAAAILPFPDVVAGLDDSAFDLASLLRPVADVDPLQLELRVTEVRPEAIYASLCSWALISPAAPRLVAGNALSAQEVSALLGPSLGLQAIVDGEAAPPAATGFRIRANAGDVFHPLLPSVLALLPVTVSAVAWEALLVGGPPGQAAAVWELRPPCPAGVVIAAGGMDLSAYASRAAVPANRSGTTGGNVLVVPACLTARYSGAGFEPNAAVARLTPLTPGGTAPSMAIVVAGPDFTGITATLAAVARQVTAQPAPLILVADEAQAAIVDRLADRILRGFPQVRRLSCPLSAGAGMRWNLGLGAVDANVAILLTPGTELAGDRALETLARLAAVPGTGVVSAHAVAASGAAAALSAASEPAPPWDAWPLPTTIADSRLACWAIHRDRWQAAGGFDETAAIGPVWDRQFALRLGRMGYHNLRSGVTAHTNSPSAAAPSGSSAAEWALQACYPEAAAGQRQPRLAAVSQLSFRGGRAGFADPATRQRRIDQSRADFLAQVLLEERRAGIERRAEFLEQLSAAAQVTAALDKTVADLQRCLESVDAAAACVAAAEGG